MKTFTFYIQGLATQMQVEAATMQQARNAAWALLSDDEKDAVVCFDCIDEQCYGG